MLPVGVGALSGLGLAAALLVLACSSAQAHPANVARADIVITDRRLEIALSANLFELDLMLALDRDLDAVVERPELDAKRPEIVGYLERTIVVSANGQPLPLAAGPFAIRKGVDGKAQFEVTIRFDSARALEGVRIRCEPLTELGADHTTLARIRMRGATEQFAFRRGAVWEPQAGIVARSAQFLKLGVLHIFTGYDHIAFLIGLLITGGRLFGLVQIVTAFTLAHSLTLTLAALDVVTLHPGLVEGGIALSIVYVALENLLWPTHDRRWLVSFVFGLVHGFGFAAVLREMHLPRSGLAASLFSFNLGVEVGQVLIVLLLVPLLWLLVRSRVQVVLARSVSIVLLSLGLFWLYQRALS
jgi:hypothetical protein